ncbi:MULTISPECIES: hypothetical protein [unclassified Streptomyces]|uniref:hypothetical protein n=1 Tax=unclassified Streptomyces TaxID=2593676 RepID=UPI00136B5781|nr:MULTISPECIES: hypothetical protein [unclassified Streptomyces]MYU02199.1 hypothetical protein [Streptomyces sp. SID8350]
MAGPGGAAAHGCCWPQAHERMLGIANDVGPASLFVSLRRISARGRACWSSCTGP